VHVSSELPNTKNYRQRELVLSNLCTKETKKMKKLFAQFAKDESGATAIEYGLIAALIAVVIIGALTTVGGNLTTMLDTVAGSL